MLRRSTALAVITLWGGVLLTTAPATAVSETCQGRPATIVGTGPDIQGTAGDDVIVTGASRITRADAGNDLVCVTPSPHEDLFVDAGAGDDVVDATILTTPMTVAHLGAGLDRYLGGPAYDEVRAYGADDDVADADWIVLQDAEPATGPVGNYTGAFISVWSADQDVEIELDAHVMVAGTVAADIAGFSWASAAAPRAIVRGNAEDNMLRASGCDVHVFGKGGDDYLDGYAGEDAPTFDCDREASMRGGQGDDRIKGSLGRNRLTGDAGNDRLQGRSHADLLLGGSGRDDLFGGAGPDVLRGNGGNDTLRGNPGRDTLLGNRGRDTADGHNGNDHCIAERERRCER